MNALPFLGLALIASGYAAATDRLDAWFAAQPEAEIVAYDAGGDLAIYDMLGHGAQPYDQPHCEAHAAMAENLNHDFAEEPVETRVSGDGLTMELWASDLLGTWTVVHKGEDGVSCIVSSGTGWEDGANPDLAFGDAGLAS